MGERIDNAPGMEDWRDGLSRRLAYMVSGLTALALAVAVGLVTEWWTRAILLGVAAPVAIAMFVLARNQGVRSRLRSQSIIVMIFMLSMMGYAAVGPLAGPAAGSATLTLLAGVLLGRRAMYWSLVATVVGVAALSLLMVNRIIPAPHLNDVSPLHLATWGRTLAVCLIITTGAAAATTYVVERLEASTALAHDEAERRALAERDQRQVVKAAAEAQRLEAIGRLAAGVAHDFNNTLHVVKMWCGLLERSATGTTLEAVAEIDKATTQAARLASQLLVLGRRDAAMPTQIELGGLVEDFRTSLGRVMMTDIDLKVRLDARAIVLADEIQIQQALLNLAINARDAMPEGGTLSITVRAEEIAEPRTLTTGTIGLGRWGILEVTDTGTGMPAAVRENVFKPFFTTKETGVGTGLGLSTLLGVVQRSGGQVDLWSEPNQGTRISLWLPVRAAVGTTAEAPQPKAASARPPSSVRVLLVEDHDINRRLVTRVLVEAGYLVQAVADVDSAIAAIETAMAADQGFDLLLADVVMPHTPVSTLLTLFENSFGAGRILLCSGYVEEELTRRGIIEGRYPFLPKPIDPSRLLAALAKTLDDRESQSASS